MNKQLKHLPSGKLSRGIEWTDYSWNPVSGCQHACRWTMPDGQIAVCYAEEAANGVARSAYPDGFAHHYWHPERLSEPLQHKKPARIFLDSMSDLMGPWVPDEQIRAVLDVCARADWHTFQLLTKNAPRLLKFDFPPNLWVGVSTPPDFILGQRLSDDQKERMLGKALHVLDHVSARIKWMSVEPLSWNVAPIFEAYLPLHWAVIGAASDGSEYHQPNPHHVQALLDVFDQQHVCVFYKGNLDWKPRREEFPWTS